MVANSETKKQATSSAGKADKPVPGKQDILDMLASWCNLALESEVELEQLFDLEKGRFTVRVYGVNLVDSMLIAAPDSDSQK